MKSRLLAAAALILCPMAAHASEAASPDATYSPNAKSALPAQLDDAQRSGYRIVFAAIRAQDWTGAQLQLDSMQPGLLHAIAHAELYTAKNSPKVTADQLIAVLSEAPELPQADQLARMAKARGAVELPPLPVAQRLTWIPGAPVRGRAKTIASDNMAVQLAMQMQPFIKADDGLNAETLLTSVQDQLTPEALAEWRQKVAWIYYTAGDDTNSRRMAEGADQGAGDWTIHADWVRGLASWRLQDYQAADDAFQAVASRATDVELRAAALYWASRADLASGRPERTQPHLKAASQYDETFYGQLAREALAIDAKPGSRQYFASTDWQALSNRPNIRVAAALIEIGENDLADEVLRRQASIGNAQDYPALVRLTAQMNLPQTELWLSNNGPAGAQAPLAARYPMPDWTPDSGWRVDRELVFAHTLQESRFRTSVVSGAGAYGLMQIMPAAATDYNRATGLNVDRSALTKPSTNMDIGQTHLERLRDMAATQGLLPKVIAAYNAGPAPVATWNTMVRDNGDPLLYIESIPYWETRGYVTTVLRNYWMYEGQSGKPSASRTALAQGLWPRFPGMSGPSSVRITAAASAPVAMTIAH